jgi:hypothetical protein
MLLTDYVMITMTRITECHAHILCSEYGRNKYYRMLISVCQVIHHRIPTDSNFDILRENLISRGANHGSFGAWYHASGYQLESMGTIIFK